MDNDAPFDLHAALGGMAKRKEIDPESDIGQCLDFGLKMAREAKRMIIAECEKRFPDQLALQCTASMIAGIIQMRAEEHAAMQAPEGTAPRKVWDAMSVLLVPENLGFASKDEADELDGVK